MTRNTQVEMIGKSITHCSEEELKNQVGELLAWLHKGHYNLNEYQIVILEISFSFARFYKKYQITSDTEFAGSKEDGSEDPFLKYQEKNWITG